tara:strand:+ start:423 stop:599 length:177 start_codon:yes stop_codon:yes gene_type:complete
MSKIHTTRLPSFYNKDYNPEQLNQLVLVLERVLTELNSGYTPPQSENNTQAMAWFFGK